MKNLIYSVLIGFLFMGLSASAWASQEYELDVVHSSIDFSVAHLVVTKTTGAFEKFEADIVFDKEDLGNSYFNVSIDVASINTRNEKRDDHLRGPDFFDVAQHPSIIFKSKSVSLQAEDAYDVVGDVTMKGVTKEIAILVLIQGPVDNPFGGGAILGVEAGFLLNRQDYGVSWNKTLDNGGVVVGDEVTARVNFELHAK